MTDQDTGARVCRNCRYWNGAGARVAPCFKVKGIDPGPGSLAGVLADGAGFLHPSAGVSSVAYLYTGPAFGCTSFSYGKPRYFGDDGSDMVTVDSSVTSDVH